MPILVASVETRARLALQQRLVGRATVYPAVVISCSDDLLRAIETAVRDFENGQPLLARKFVVALLIIRKLEKLQMWGGKDKGYLYSSDLPKGRGIPAEVADVVHEVANYLKNVSILTTKPGRAHVKYALNSKIRPEIHETLARRSFTAFPGLQRILERDPQSFSARILDNEAT